MNNEDFQYSRRRRNNNIEQNTKRSILSWKKILMYIICFIFLSGIIYTAYTWNNFKNSTTKGYKDVDYVSAVDPNFRKFSVLILGIDENDSREAEGQTRETSRTDSMIYMAINKDKSKMDMISIPRDSLTLMREKENDNDASSYFYDKITHAHAYDDVRGTINATENLLNSPVNFYILINFKAFEQTVNAFGGIDLYVPFDMDEQNANGELNTVKLEKGWHTLNGEQALAFCRSRYYDSDIERGQRQLQAIHALIDKSKSLNALTKINEVINIVGNNVEHNLTPTQISSAIKMFLGGDIKITSHRIDGYDVMYAGVYYYYPKPSSLLYISSAIHDTLDMDLPKADDILNIHNQGYINIGVANYINKTTDTPRLSHYPLNLVQFESQDLLKNLPDQLTLQDLKDDPTVSNENKPSNENSSSS